MNDHGTHEALYLRDPDENGLELAWDRPEDRWPRDAEGHLTFSGRQLDLEGLLREGSEPAQGNTRRAPENSEA
jgi:catechol 2,3-dioxygenase